MNIQEPAFSKSTLQKCKGQVAIFFYFVANKKECQTLFFYFTAVISLIHLHHTFLSTNSKHINKIRYRINSIMMYI